MSAIPSYLLAPPTAQPVSPPIETAQYTLPLASLPWQDFERLCLRLVQTSFTLERCEIYGVAGQKQEGIDIFARQDDGTYASYQCKRYQKMTSATLEEVVRLFKTSEWASKSTRFILCTSAELNLVTLQNTFNELYAQLATDGIEFEKWDFTQLQRLLKEEPHIVYDFFGGAWVRAFNGEAAHAEVSARRKLDNAQVAAYRRQLRAFYTVVFNQYDPGLPMQELQGEPVRLLDRFIVPDAYQEQTAGTSYPDQVEATQTVEALQEQRQLEQMQDLYTRRLPSQQATRPNTSDYFRLPRQARVPVTQQLVRHPRTIILGDPGAGKSTLLRYLALDLLSDAPTLGELSQSMGVKLPVWLPFAYITRQLSQQDTLSLPELLRQWFASMSQPHLFELVQQALDDERLVLLIDGVDEWTSQATAEQALARIEIQVNVLDTPVIYSSRPYGYRLLREYLPGIRQIELAPFSRSQQEEFVRGWFAQWLRTVEPSSLHEADGLTTDFFAELVKNSDLAQLAENPLLLSILVMQKLRDSVLPRNRIDALRDITDYLLNRRPRKRRYEAGLSDDDVWDFPLEDVFAELAFHLQQHSSDGTLLKTEAARVAENYLVRQVGYEPGRAKKVGRELLELSANSLGIIIEKSPEEWAFRHRQFQEYLAAKYLNDSNPDRVREVLRTYGPEQPWNQVLLTFFARIPARRDQEFTDYLSQLTYAGPSRAKAHYLRLLRYDLSLRLPNAPVPLAKSVLADLQREFELEQDAGLRQSLLRLLMGAAENPRLKRSVFAYFGTFFPATFKYGDFRLPALRQVSSAHLSVAQQALLWQSLRHGTTGIQLQASATLGVFMELPAVARIAVSLLEPSIRPDLTAMALNVLAGPAVLTSTKQAAVAQLAGRVSGQQLLFWLKLKVQLGTHTLEDLSLLLDRPAQFGHEVQEELLNLLAKGWPTSPELLNTCLSDISRGWSEGRKLEPEVAWKILFHCFHYEERVIKRIVEEIENEKYPFNFSTSYQVWQWIANYLKDHPRLVAVVDAWLLTQDHMGPEMAFASLVGRTATARELLLSSLAREGVPHWPIMALLEGWGDELQVQAALKEYFQGPAKDKHYAAHYVDQIFADEPQTGVDILEAILFDRSLYFRDRALLPLIQLDRTYFEHNLLKRFLTEELPELPRDTFSQYYSALSTLVEQFSAHESVQALIFAPQSQQDPYIADLLIRHYPADTEAIDVVVSTSLPLAVAERLQLIAKLGERFVADEQSLKILASFEAETDDRLRCEAALRYFQLTPDQEAVRAVCTRLAFFRGMNHEANRQLAFVGFLLLDELPGYFALRDGQELANPGFTFNTKHGLHGHEVALIPVLAAHFDRLHAGITGDFSRITHRYFGPDKEQNIWGALAQYALLASPVIPYLQAYAAEYSATLHHPELLTLLAQTAPGSDLLKQLALRLVQSIEETEFLFAAEVLGRQFAAHPDVGNFIADIQDPYRETGKIITATLGWPTLPILVTLYEQAKGSQWHFTKPAIFHLKFLLRDVTNIAEFIAYTHTHSDELKVDHHHFIRPLLARVRRDDRLQDCLLTELQCNEHAAIQISCYALLNSGSDRTADLIEWKEGQQQSLDRYGYNIVENRVMSLADSIYEIWY